MSDQLSELARAQLELARAQLVMQIGSDESFTAIIDAQTAALRAGRAENQQKLAAIIERLGE